MDNLDDVLAQLEASISENDIRAARRNLRKWFSLQSSTDSEASSVGDWLAPVF